MKAFVEPMGELAHYDDIKRDIAEGRTPVQLDGCIDAGKCHMISCLGRGYKYKLIVTYNELRAREIYSEYSFFDKKVRLYPAKDLIFFNADIHSDLISGQRLFALRPLMDGEPVTIVTTVEGLQDAILSADYLKSFCIELRVGERIDLEALIKKLVWMGFERTGQVEAPGQFSIRGGIFDFYNQTDDNPCRVELWDDEIDSIRSFDAQSQRSMEQCESAVIYPAGEYVFTEEIRTRGLKNIDKDLKKQAKKLRDMGDPEAAARLEERVSAFKDDMESGLYGANVDSYAYYFFSSGKRGEGPELISLLDYFDGRDSLVLLDEPGRMAERGEAVTAEYTQAMLTRLSGGYALPGQMKAISDYRMIISRISSMRSVLLYTLPPSSKQSLSPKSMYSIDVSGMKSYMGNFPQLVADLKRWKQQKYRVILVSRSSLRGRQLASELMEEGLEAFYTDDAGHELLPRQIMIVHGDYSGGIEYHQIRFAIIAESDIFGEDRGRRSKRRKKSAASALNTLKGLETGDYVVHEKYGIGIYRGINQIKKDGVLKDHVKIDYADGGSLYVLASNLDSIQKYAGKDAESVKVNKLSGKEWSRTKSGVKKAVRELADDLIRLYAVRQNSAGYKCGPDTVWQREFEELFPFEETSDQLDAVDAVKRDMESGRIMDRLLCGDVGFGKTEVAIRAAFKMVQEGRQCAVLVPTTILAQQHFNTFSQRMKNYPIKIAVLSRFRTAAEIKQSLADLKSGRLDIVIGTHRLLSKDVEYSDLGLLIVDEEQRFGVSHKEKIKKMKETVDVLTLTATPIPRTMHMGLIGIRDISLLSEAPADRLPIQTYVMEYNEEMIREAIEREIKREGQVYYVYNRVTGIEDVAARIKKLVPDARVAYAHGRMNGREIENVMYNFINRELDVLVATSIVETGLDIPNVNTMIIQDADRFGLSQLYQLRGRIGRSGRTSYAFLTYRRDKLLRETAEKRLSAIREFSQLGSGYRIALRDLEIRGAGSLLGERQSGNIARVGYDLYCKLLAGAVSEAKGEEKKEDFETSVEINLDAYIPDSYIFNEASKLDMYKRIATLQNYEEYSDILDEMTDRYGDLPEPASALLKISLIRAEGHSAFITNVKEKEGQVVFRMLASAPLDISGISGLGKKYGQRVRFKADKYEPAFSLDIRKVHRRELADEVLAFVRDLKGLIEV